MDFSIRAALRSTFSGAPSTEVAASLFSQLAPSLRAQGVSETVPCLDALRAIAQQTSGGPRACGYVFKEGDIGYHCRQCQVDGSCVLCQACYRASAAAGAHDGHDVSYYRAGMGGCCDCGDEEAWSLAGACPTHGGGNAGADGSSGGPDPDAADEAVLAQVTPSLQEALTAVISETLSFIHDTNLRYACAAGREVLTCSCCAAVAQASAKARDSPFEVSPRDSMACRPVDLAAVARETREGGAEAHAAPHPIAVRAAPVVSWMASTAPNGVFSPSSARYEPPPLDGEFVRDNTEAMCAGAAAGRAEPAATYNLVVINDDVHTYEQVSHTLQLAVPSINRAQAEEFTKQVDVAGEAVITSGTLCEIAGAARGLRASGLHYALVSAPLALRCGRAVRATNVLRALIEAAPAVVGALLFRILSASTRPHHDYNRVNLDALITLTTSFSLSVATASAVSGAPPIFTDILLYTNCVPPVLGRAQHALFLSFLRVPRVRAALGAAFVAAYTDVAARHVRQWGAESAGDAAAANDAEASDSEPEDSEFLGGYHTLDLSVQLLTVPTINSTLGARGALPDVVVGALAKSLAAAQERRAAPRTAVEPRVSYANEMIAFSAICPLNDAAAVPTEQEENAVQMFAAPGATIRHLGARAFAPINLRIPLVAPTGNAASRLDRICSDVRVVLSVPGGTSRLLRRAPSFYALLRSLGAISGTDLQTLKTGEHVERANADWLAAFNTSIRVTLSSSAVTEYMRLASVRDAGATAAVHSNTDAPLTSREAARALALAGASIVEWASVRAAVAVATRPLLLEPPRPDDLLGSLGFVALRPQRVGAQPGEPGYALGSSLHAPLHRFVASLVCSVMSAAAEVVEGNVSGVAQQVATALLQRDAADDGENAQERHPGCFESEAPPEHAAEMQVVSAEWGGLRLAAWSRSTLLAATTVEAVGDAHVAVGLDAVALLHGACPTGTFVGNAAVDHIAFKRLARAGALSRAGRDPYLWLALSEAPLAALTMAVQQKVGWWVRNGSEHATQQAENYTIAGGPLNAHDGDLLALAVALAGAPDASVAVARLLDGFGIRELFQPRDFASGVRRKELALVGPALMTLAALVTRLPLHMSGRRAPRDALFADAFGPAAAAARAAGANLTNDEADALASQVRLWARLLPTDAHTNLRDDSNDDMDGSAGGAVSTRAAATDIPTSSVARLAKRARIDGEALSESRVVETAAMLQARGLAKEVRAAVVHALISAPLARSAVLKATMRTVRCADEDRDALERALDATLAEVADTRAPTLTSATKYALKPAVAVAEYDETFPLRGDVRNSARVEWLRARAAASPSRARPAVPQPQLTHPPLLRVRAMLHSTVTALICKTIFCDALAGRWSDARARSVAASLAAAAGIENSPTTVTAFENHLSAASSRGFSDDALKAALVILTLALHCWPEADEALSASAGETVADAFLADLGVPCLVTPHGGPPRRAAEGTDSINHWLSHHPLTLASTGSAVKVSHVGGSAIDALAAIAESDAFQTDDRESATWCLDALATKSARAAAAVKAARETGGVESAGGPSAGGPPVATLERKRAAQARALEAMKARQRSFAASMGEAFGADAASAEGDGEMADDGAAVAVEPPAIFSDVREPLFSRLAGASVLTADPSMRASLVAAETPAALECAVCRRTGDEHSLVWLAHATPDASRWHEVSPSTAASRATFYAMLSESGAGSAGGGAAPAVTPVISTTASSAPMRDDDDADQVRGRASVTAASSSPKAGALHDFTNGDDGRLPLFPADSAFLWGRSPVPKTSDVVANTNDVDEIAGGFDASVTVPTASESARRFIRSRVKFEGIEPDFVGFSESAASSADVGVALTTCGHVIHSHCLHASRDKAAEAAARNFRGALNSARDDATSLFAFACPVCRAFSNTTIPARAAAWPVAAAVRGLPPTALPLGDDSVGASALDAPFRRMMNSAVAAPLSASVIKAVHDAVSTLPAHLSSDRAFGAASRAISNALPFSLEATPDTRALTPELGEVFELFEPLLSTGSVPALTVAAAASAAGFLSPTRLPGPSPFSIVLACSKVNQSVSATRTAQSRLNAVLRAALKPAHANNCAGCSVALDFDQDVPANLFCVVCCTAVFCSHECMKTSSLHTAARCSQLREARLRPAGDGLAALASTLVAHAAEAFKSSGAVTAENARIGPTPRGAPLENGLAILAGVGHSLTASLRGGASRAALARWPDAAAALVGLVRHADRVLSPTSFAADIATLAVRANFGDSAPSASADDEAGPVAALHLDENEHDESNSEHDFNDEVEDDDDDDDDEDEDGDDDEGDDEEDFDDDDGDYDDDDNDDGDDGVGQVPHPIAQGHAVTVPGAAGSLGAAQGGPPPPAPSSLPSLVPIPEAAAAAGANGALQQAEANIISMVMATIEQVGAGLSPEHVEAIMGIIPPGALLRAGLELPTRLVPTDEGVLALLISLKEAFPHGGAPVTPHVQVPVTLSRATSTFYCPAALAGLSDALLDHPARRESNELLRPTIVDELAPKRPPLTRSPHPALLQEPSFSSFLAQRHLRN